MTDSIYAGNSPIISASQAKSKENFVVELKSGTLSISLTLSEAEIQNVSEYSKYLNEVFRLAEESECARVVVLEEKDVNLAVQFFLTLVQLNDTDNLPDLSYNLGFADLASKWIVDRCLCVVLQNYQKFLNSDM
jgi:hypothetical protein